MTRRMFFADGDRSMTLNIYFYTENLLHKFLKTHLFILIFVYSRVNWGAKLNQTTANDSKIKKTKKLIVFE